MVVVDLDAGLARKRAGDPADVLHNSGPTGDGKGEEQGVTSGEIEAFAEVRSCRQQKDGVSVVLEVFEGCLVLIFPGAAFQHGGFEAAARTQFASEGFEVLGAVREHQDIPTPLVGVGDVGADMSGALGVGGDQSEDHLYRGPLGCIGVGEGLVHDEIAADQDRGGGILAHDVTSGSELHVQDALESVPAAGVAVKPTQRRLAALRTHRSKVTAGR